jgi:hypothetical protein
VDAMFGRQLVNCLLFGQNLPDDLGLKFGGKVAFRIHSLILP